jgi:hypothetical protein
MEYVIPDLELLTRKDCIYSCLKTILHYKKKDFSEIDLFLMSKPLCFYYESVDDKIDPQNIGETNFKFDDYLSNITLFKSNIINFDSIDDFCQKTYDALRNNNPILLYLFTDQLRYHKLFSNDLRRIHCILLYGLDIRNNVAYIADPFIKLYSGEIHQYSGPIPISSFIDNLLTTAWIDLSDFQAVSDDQLINEIRKSIFDYLSGCKTADGTYIGISALKEYCDNLKYLIFLENDDYFLKKCINISYTFALMYPIAFCDFLSEYFVKNRLGSFSTIQKLKNIVEQWENLRLVLLKVGITKNKEMIGDIVKRCRNIINLQELALREALLILI